MTGYDKTRSQSRSSFALQLMRRLALFMLAIMLMLASLVAGLSSPARLQPQSAAASVPSPSPTPTATAQPTPTPSAIPLVHTRLIPGARLRSWTGA